MNIKRLDRFIYLKQKVHDNVKQTYGDATPK